MSIRSITTFLQVASLLMLLLAVALLAAIATMHFAIHGAEVQVPALKGMTVQQARSETAGLALNLDVDNRYYSGDVAAGHILTQSPEPGTVVRRAWRVRVSESLGPQLVDVPDEVGKEERVAELELRRAGFDVGPLARLPYTKAPEGTVIAQDPPAHAHDIAQPSVGLLIAVPDEEIVNGYVMPDMTGWPASSAVAELAKVGIKAAPPKMIGVPVAHVGVGNAPIRPPVKPGSILSQTPISGSRIDQSTVVKLTVAR